MKEACIKPLECNPSGSRCQPFIPSAFFRLTLLATQLFLCQVHALPYLTVPFRSPRRLHCGELLEIPYSENSLSSVVFMLNSNLDLEHFKIIWLKPSDTKHKGDSRILKKSDNLKEVLLNLFLGLLIMRGLPSSTLIYLLGFAAVAKRRISLWYVLSLGTLVPYLEHLTSSVAIILLPSLPFSLPGSPWIFGLLEVQCCLGLKKKKKKSHLI